MLELGVGWTCGILAQRLSRGLVVACLGCAPWGGFGLPLVLGILTVGSRG